MLWRKGLEAELEGRIDDAAAWAVRALEVGLKLPAARVISDALRESANYASAGAGHTYALDAIAVAEGLAANLHTRAVDSQLYRLHALVAAEPGREAEVADAFAVALASARNLGSAFYIAPVLHDYGAWLVAGGRTDEAEPLLAEARELFEQMGAVAWLRRLDTLPQLAVPAA